MATENASLASFFCDLPDARTRTRADNVGGTWLRRGARRIGTFRLGFVPRH
jgi:hypothetical protein